ncbi:tryptophan 2,3-dioxygenase [Tropicimonas aquimaris]|uniref:Tryptophan 2,3-dioxygenase n=1 Tax=Tropicimonas aquimaris TaxID=914152 RepID=A0ABW3IVV3_9RHOB
MSSGEDFSYVSHLALDRLLSAQQPVSDRHDEMLFIIQHQTSELWMRLVIVELEAARTDLRARDLRAALKALGRVGVVFDQLVSSWDVLRTLTPVDFASFRGDLGNASGFQSFQYRMIEFILGNRSVEMLEPHRRDAAIVDALIAELARPSVYQQALGCLGAELGVDLSGACIPRNDAHAPDPDVLQAWGAVYADPDRYPALFDLAEALVGIEDRFRCWRFNHVTTVERVIGFKRGTGGTSGVSYLRRMLDVELFPELWQVRTTI